MTNRQTGRLPGALPALHPLGPDALTAPFWDAARQHRLVAARCDDCGRFRHPPAAYCPNCNHQSVTWTQLSGDAAIYTFTIARHPVIPELVGHTPYVIAAVEPVDAPDLKLITNIVTDDPDTLRIGQPVRVAFDDLDDETTIPRFVPA